MKSPKHLIVLGTSGNSIAILDTVAELNEASPHPLYECIGVLDDSESDWGTSFHGVDILGPLASASDYPDAYFVNGIGSTANFWKKAVIIDKTSIPDERFVTLIHPTASVSSMTTIGPGTVLLQNVTVNSHVSIGKHAIILPSTVLSHHDRVGNYTCIAAGACISGHVQVGSSCYLGTNCSIRDYVKVGDNSLVGMGAVVLADVQENSVVVGNPARFLRHAY